MTIEMEEDKPRTVLVTNIPRGTQKREIEQVFGDIGPLKRCYIQYPRQDKKKLSEDEDNLLCYLTYALGEDAVKAIETLSHHKFGKNKVSLKLVKNNRNEQTREREKPRRENLGFSRGEEEEEDGYKNPNLIPVGGVKPKRPKKERPKPINKKSRLIVRNLSFKVTEDKIKEHFGHCGEVKEVNLLKKRDGKLVGCAFVQFATVPQAAKALRELNLKELLGRPIAIDWALPKKDFQTEKKQGDKEVVEVKSEDEVEDVKIKVEPENPLSDEDVDFANPYESMEADVKKEEKDKDPNISNRKRKVKEEEDEDEEDSDSKEDEISPKRPRVSNDVEEGKTLFIRNLDFSVTQEELKTFFDSYGKTLYALICKDSLTEHPKGTGFVKFKELADAQNCLLAYSDDPLTFRLNDRQFNLTAAISKEKIALSSSGRQEKVKQDNRNLFLVREGFIRPGSSAAEGVSVTDLNKRASLNSTKKQLLKNLSIFVSRTRLCVHNLPPKLNDKALRKLFKRHSPPEARITEVRIMRNMKDIQLNGTGKSKGFGFVTFTEHEHALAALRTINNNPAIFTVNQRPIVEFSLENKRALRAKETRLQKSVESNPMKKAERQTKQRHNRTTAKAVSGKKNEVDARNDDKTKPSPKVPFVGLSGKPGISKLPVMKAKGKGGKISRKSVKLKKPKKKMQERRMREPQIKPKKSIEKLDKAEKLVSRHKEKLELQTTIRGSGKRTKWYNK